MRMRIVRMRNGTKQASNTTATEESGVYLHRDDVIGHLQDRAAPLEASYLALMDEVNAEAGDGVPIPPSTSVTELRRMAAAFENQEI